MQLLPNNFLRVYRSYIVNMNLVKKLKLKEGGRYTFQIDDNLEIPIGRTKYKEVKEYFDKI